MLFFTAILIIKDKLFSTVKFLFVWLLCHSIMQFLFFHFFPPFYNVSETLPICDNNWREINMCSGQKEHHMLMHDASHGIKPFNLLLRRYTKIYQFVSHQNKIYESYLIFSCMNLLCLVRRNMWDGLLSSHQAKVQVWESSSKKFKGLVG